MIKLHWVVGSYLWLRLQRFQQSQLKKYIFISDRKLCSFKFSLGSRFIFNKNISIHTCIEVFQDEDFYTILFCLSNSFIFYHILALYYIHL